MSRTQVFDVLNQLSHTWEKNYVMVLFWNRSEHMFLYIVISRYHSIS